MQLVWMFFVATALLLSVPAKGHSFVVGEQPSIKYSRHNLMGLNRIDGSASVMEGVMYDNLGQICVYCHTPHNANKNYDAPLWNRVNDTTTFQIYSSLTLDAAPNQPGGVSRACLSCHDGTIAVDAVMNKPMLVGSDVTGYRMDVQSGGDRCGNCHGSGSGYDHTSRYLGTNLQNDHPVSIDYSEAYNAQSPSEFAPVGSIEPLKLFNGKVECASCHDVHKPSDPVTVDQDPSPSGVNLTVRSFHLRRSNNSSQLCLTCHVK